MRLAIFLLCLSCSGAALADLDRYVARPDPAFSWSLAANHTSEADTAYRLTLTSQTWRGIDWKHDLDLYVPDAARMRHTLLFIGGAPGDAHGMRALAQRLRAPVAVLRQVPNQPLLDGLYEDDLIAETFLRFLRTGEDDWPLLAPMTKSAVRAMDALQAFSRQHLKHPIERFVLTGASKRGWTTWLAGAVDTRVAGIAPRVIDMLNVPAQLPHQLESWGAYSEMLSSYTEPGLPQFIATAPGKRLLELVDPYAYRDRLTMPKLVVLGTNDRYWTLDALNLYWDGLRGENSVLYVPNAGHGLNGDQHWLDTLACFFRSVASARPLPRPEAIASSGPGAVSVRVAGDTDPVAAQLWSARAPALDFREAKWTAQPMQRVAGAYAGSTDRAPDASTAMFTDVHYDIDGERCILSTRVSIFTPGD